MGLLASSAVFCLSVVDSFSGEGFMADCGQRANAMLANIVLAV